MKSHYVLRIYKRSGHFYTPRQLTIATLYAEVCDGNQMASSTFDSNKFKMDQREGWNSVAGGWKEWWQLIEKGAQKLSQRLIELAEIKS